MNRKPFESKIYIPKNAEGRSNTEALNLIREIEEKFENNPAFVGIVFKGSKIHGYIIDNSDLDLIILFDSLRIDRKVDDNSFTTEYTLDRKAHLFYRDVNLDNLLHDLDLDPSGKEIGPVIVTLAILTEVVTGNKIQLYRDKIRAKFKELSIENSDKIKKRVVNYLMEKEIYSMSKATHRIPNLESEKEQIIIKRRQLWESRFDKVWLGTKKEKQ